MAWRDARARATLIREAAGSMEPGKTPRAFAELLFDHTNIEDLVNYDAASLAFLAEQAWEHVQQRTAGSADIRVINPMMPDGREISVLEVLNDNMPFLFDSTMAELAEQGIEVTLVAHPIIAVERDQHGKLLRFYGETLTEGTKGERESLIHFHIARLDADADRRKLIEGLAKTLNDVRACVSDWRAMRARVEQAIKTFNSNPPPLPIDEIAEANQFLQWLCADNFTFLGLREYRFSSDTDASDEISTGQGLGILRDPDVKILRRGNEMVVMTQEIREFMREPTILIVIKANVNSRVHRRVRMDYVGIKLYTPDGRLEGELRLVGLFTSGAYTRSARQIPYIRRKVAQVLERAGFDADSHSGFTSVPACGRWHGPINSTVSSPSSSSFRVINMTPMCVRVSRSFWRRSIRGAWQRPTPPFPKGRLPASTTSSGDMTAKRLSSSAPRWKPGSAPSPRPGATS